MVPLGLAAAGGGVLAAAVAPEAAAGAGVAGLVARLGGPRLLGAAATMFPFAAGENVQRQVSETGDLTSPGKALALGVPEAAVQALLPGRLEKVFGEGILRGIAHGAATQGFAGGATEWLTQKMGDPNRSFADRASAITQQALSGGVLGGIVGGAFGGMHELVGKSVAKISTDDLNKVTAQALAPVAEAAPAAAPAAAEPAATVPAAAPVAPITDPALASLTNTQLGQRMVDGKLSAAQRQQAGDELRAREANVASAAAPAAAEPAAPAAAPAVPEAIDRLHAAYNEIAGGEQMADAGDVARRAGISPAEFDQAMVLGPGQDAVRSSTGHELQLLGSTSSRGRGPAFTVDGRPYYNMRFAEPPPEVPGEPPAPGAPAAAAEPAAPPEIDFTKGRVKEGTALYEAAADKPEVQTAMRLPLVDELVAREDAKIDPTKLQIRWGKALDVFDDEGKVKSALRSEVMESRSKVETPSGVEPEVPAPEVPAAPVAAPTAPVAPTKPAPGEMPDIPDFLRRAPRPVASDAPINTVDDRAATLSGVAPHIVEIAKTNPEAAQEFADEVKFINGSEANAKNNPGLAKALNTRAENLRSAVAEKAQLPGNQVASSASPHAEVVPAPINDLGTSVEKAQSELSKLKDMLGNRANALAGVEQHENWLAEAKAAKPDQLKAVLDKDPEALAAVDETGKVPDLGGLRQLSDPQKEQLAAYLNAQQKVLQGLQANSGRARVISSRDGAPVNQLDADVTDMSQRGVKMHDALDHIAEHSVDPEEAELAAWVKQGVPKNVMLAFRDGVTDKEGEYFPKQQTSVLYNAANATVTTLHEAVHAALSWALNGTSAAAQAMRGIYDQLKSKGDHAGITDAHEMVAEGIANPVYRSFLKSQFVQGTSMWDRFIDAARNMIGLPPRLFNAFDRIMSHGDDLMKEQQQYPNDAWVGPDSYARVTDNALGSAAKGAAQGISQWRQWLSDRTFNISEKTYKFVLNMMRDEWIATDNRKVMPAGMDYIAAKEKLDPRTAALTQGQNEAAAKLFRALPEEGQTLANQLMGLTADYKIDPNKPLDKHPSIINEQDPAIRANLVNRYNEATAVASSLRNIKGGMEAFNAFRSNGSAQIHMNMLNKIQSAERMLQSANPNYKFVDAYDTFSAHPELHSSPQKTEGFFVNTFADKLTNLSDYRDTLSASKVTGEADVQKAIAAGVDKDTIKNLTEQNNALGDRADKVNAVIKDVTAQQKRVQEAPYFHLGRDGEHFGTAKFVTDADGNIDREKLTQFREFMDSKGFDDIAINLGGDNDTIYSRVRNPSEMRQLARTMEEAQKLGLLSKDSPVKAGKVTDVFPQIAPAAVRLAVEALKNLPQNIPEGFDPETVAAIKASRGDQLADLQRILMNTTQENSVSRLLTRRANVQGYSKDMASSQIYATDVMGRSNARMSLMSEIGDALGKMSEQVKAANADKTVSYQDRLAASNALAELTLREQQRQTYVAPSWMDMLRTVTHTIHIGLSPAYFLMLQSQNFTTGLPELAKTHGYARAAQAMAKVVPEAFAIDKAILTSPNWADAGITYDGLNGKVSPTTRDFVLRLVNNGTLGTLFAKTQLEDSPYHSNTIVKASNALGLHAELLPRLISALAARDLYEAEPYVDPRTGQQVPLDQFIKKAVGESQGYWGAGMGSRLTSRYGFAGPLTPIIDQFMGWRIQMTTKMYREVGDLFAGENADVKKEAATWLAGHAAATAVFAGTLGLPMLSVAASVYDWAKNHLTGQDDTDITASYRNFLASTFGKNAGEIIARGLPRAAGMDFAHWGEGNIVPGSDAILAFTEKRKLEDMERDWAKSMTGPAVGDVFNLAAAVRDVSNGDYLNGLIRMAPEIIKAPAEAFRLGQRGFVNNLTGQKLPMSASAYDIALTLLAIDPAKQAEYQEVSRDAAGLRNMRELASSNIVRHMELAYTQGDRGKFNAWMGEAQKWQQEHPGMVPPQVGFQRELENHIRQTAQARGRGLPLGVEPQNISAQRVLRYGNIPVQ
jgi:hypothetical protein